jgi:hypothetical protein
MIQSNKIFRAHSESWDYGSTDEPKYYKNPIFKHFFFMPSRTKNQIIRINGNTTHLRIHSRKIFSRHFQLVRVSYQKLDFHGISRFSAVFIINTLNAWRYNSGTMYAKSLFRLSFNRSDKKTPTLAFQNLFERNVCIPVITLCIQTDFMKYEISSQCKANEK